MLTVQGLIEFSPRRGAAVTRLSVGELDDLIAVLSGPEVLAVRLSGGRVAESDLDLLGRCLVDCERAIEGGDIAACRSADDQFHRLIVATSGSRRLGGLYDSLLRQAQMWRFRTRATSTPCGSPWRITSGSSPNWHGVTSPARRRPSSCTGSRAGSASGGSTASSSGDPSSRRVRTRFLLLATASRRPRPPDHEHPERGEPCADPQP